MSEEIHNLLKIENDKTTIFTNKELKMIDDYINELEAYKYNMDRDYLRLEKENKKLKEVIDKLSSQIKLYGKYNGEKCIRGFSMMTADFNKLLDILKEEK